MRIRSYGKDIRLVFDLDSEEWKHLIGGYHGKSPKLMIAGDAYKGCTLFLTENQGWSLAFPTGNTVATKFNIRGLGVREAACGQMSVPGVPVRDEQYGPGLRFEFPDYLLDSSARQAKSYRVDKDPSLLPPAETDDNQTAFALRGAAAKKEAEVAGTSGLRSNEPEHKPEPVVSGDIDQSSVETAPERTEEQLLQDIRDARDMLQAAIEEATKRGMEIQLQVYKTNPARFKVKRAVTQYKEV